MMDVEDALSVARNLNSCDPGDPVTAMRTLAAEVRRLRELVNDFTALQTAIVGDSGASAMLAVERMKAREAKARELAELAYRALRSRLPMPNCRDCADENGFCPNNRGMPCDSARATEWAIEIRNRLARWLEEGNEHD